MPTVIKVIKQNKRKYNSQLNRSKDDSQKDNIERAFLRILCVCCPRKLRRKYQPQLRFKQSQYPVSTMMYSSVSQHEMCRL